MTFKDKLLREHPECVHNGFIGGCKGCPKDYGYENIKPCDAISSMALDCGRRCWGREIPKPEPKPEPETEENECVL